MPSIDQHRPSLRLRLTSSKIGDIKEIETNTQHTRRVSTLKKRTHAKMYRLFLRVLMFLLAKIAPGICLANIF